MTDRPSDGRLSSGIRFGLVRQLVILPGHVLERPHGELIGFVFGEATAMFSPIPKIRNISTHEVRFRCSNTAPALVQPARRGQGREPVIHLSR
jgi:hypothetical protein